ncbi:MAG: DMT family transporter [Rhodobacteraceae bacterium]|nr:DMT family transporter [Paracoccaceae bacterium]
MSTEGLSSRRGDLLVGMAASIAVCMIGAGWQIANRYAVSTTLTPIDLALFRYAIPGLVLAPIWLRHGLLPQGVSPLLAALMVLGAGLPFGLLVMTASHFAPTSHAAVFLPGAIPLFVAATAMVVLGERFTFARVFGLMLIAVGVVLLGSIGLFGAESGVWRGDALFLFAAFLWGLYTVAFKLSGVSPWRATAMISGWSMLIVIPVWLFSNDGALLEASVFDLALQSVWQGIFAGVIGIWLFGLTVRKLGATTAAAIAASIPAMTALGGWLILMEPLGPISMAGVAIVTLGVLFSTGAVSFTLMTSSRQS